VVVDAVRAMHWAQLESPWQGLVIYLQSSKAEFRVYGFTISPILVAKSVLCLAYVTFLLASVG
jgi:hypothetical protein